jgi:hypothetical protein
VITTSVVAMTITCRNWPTATARTGARAAGVRPMRRNPSTRSAAAAESCLATPSSRISLGGSLSERRALIADAASQAMQARAIVSAVPLADVTRPPAKMPPNSATVPATDATMLAAKSLASAADAGPADSSTSAPTILGTTAVAVAWKSRLAENTTSVPA